MPVTFLCWRIGRTPVDTFYLKYYFPSFSHGFVGEHGVGHF